MSSTFSQGSPYPTNYSRMSWSQGLPWPGSDQPHSQHFLTNTKQEVTYVRVISNSLPLRDQTPGWLLSPCVSLGLAGAVNVAVSCLSGTMRGRLSCTVRDTTGAAMGSTAMAARRPSLQVSSWWETHGQTFLFQYSHNHSIMPDIMPHHRN